ncbi:DUF192 domain-containing protein [Myxococcota bacterium]|nr:DUF192 domain-containing protein [Myxococcota bacterium]MBU1431338.1 DUF192 domain-containing protein [Myxococcota bacterium]MBU1900274.1 DUF192 domain-containing protein [Myxococcota bacterium]
MIRLIALGLLLGCAKPPTPPAAPQETAPLGLASPNAACQVDLDCVGAWRPHLSFCGPVERCLEGVCATPPALSGQVSPQTGRLVFEIEGGERGVDVEIVEAPFETTRGMMCRRAMAPGWGMLFLMRETRVHSFWMHNTLIPLDMVFLDDHWRVVGVVAHAAPLSLQGRSVRGPSRVVLELPGGAAARLGLKAGHQARFYPPMR